MRGLQIQDRLHRLHKTSLGLSGQAIHEIQADVIKARILRAANGILRLGKGVAPAQQAKLIILRGLHPNG